MAFRLMILFVPITRQLLQISARETNLICKPKYAELSFFGFGQTDKINKCGNQMSDNRAVFYEEVKDAAKKDTVYIIDVREPDELKETGEIPNSLNIPLGEIVSVLQTTTDKQFKEKYGRSKPDECATIIWTCRSGKRATDAANMAEKIGFENSKIYLGSWLDWESHLNNKS